MQKSNVVTVLSNPKTGAVVTPSKNNPEWGSVMVESHQLSMRSEGMIVNARRVAFIRGDIKTLNSLMLTAGMQLPGKIVIKESLSQKDCYTGKEGEVVDPMTAVKYPSAAAKDAGIVCVCDDQPIYRKVYWTDNPETPDTLIAHTNGEQIKQFMNSLKAASPAAVKAARIAELTAIPKAKRTPAEKMELAELED